MQPSSVNSHRWSIGLCRRPVATYARTVPAILAFCERHAASVLQQDDDAVRQHFVVEQRASSAAGINWKICSEIIREEISPVVMPSLVGDEDLLAMENSNNEGGVYISRGSGNKNAFREAPPHRDFDCQYWRRSSYSAAAMRRTHMLRTGRISVLQLQKRRLPRLTFDFRRGCRFYCICSRQKLTLKRSRATSAI
jgi:hypothetical protein